MRLAEDLTLKEIQHLIAVAPITFEETDAYQDLVFKLLPVTRNLLRLIQTHMPEHSHKCPQCDEPKVKKEPPIYFSLDT